MNSRMMISSTPGSRMPKFFWMKNGSMNKTSTSTHTNALSYSRRRIAKTSDAMTIRRKTRYTAKTTGSRRMIFFSSPRM